MEQRTHTMTAAQVDRRTAIRNGPASMDCSDLRPSPDQLARQASPLERQPRVNSGASHGSRVYLKMPSERSQSFLHAPNPDAISRRPLVHIKPPSLIGN